MNDIYIKPASYRALHLLLKLYDKHVRMAFKKPRFKTRYNQRAWNTCLRNDLIKFNGMKYQITDRGARFHDTHEVLAENARHRKYVSDYNGPITNDRELHKVYRNGNDAIGRLVNTFVIYITAVVWGSVLLYSIYLGFSPVTIALLIALAFMPSWVRHLMQEHDNPKFYHELNSLE